MRAFGRRERERRGASGDSAFLPVATLSLGLEVSISKDGCAVSTVPVSFRALLPVRTQTAFYDKSFHLFF